MTMKFLAGIFFCAAVLLSCRPSEETMWEEAKAALDAGKLTESMTQLDRLLIKNDRHVKAWNARGVVKFRLKRYGQALKDFDMAAKLDTLDYRPLFNKANVLRDQQKFSEAVSFYTKALRLRPNVMEIYNNRGYAFFKLGKLNKAKEDFRFALRLAPDSEAVKNNLSKIEEMKAH